MSKHPARSAKEAAISSVVVTDLRRRGFKGHSRIFVGFSRTESTF
jgi:hypothetical protein